MNAHQALNQAVLEAETSTKKKPHLPLKVLTCGSVDDGKSTLIGRLLWDATILPEDQKQAIERSEIKMSDGSIQRDYSRLVDGLIAEREQGITIDIAFRYADLPSRRLVLIDAPGHEQYTRNMVTGASQADIALILVDARQGLTEQTRRHAAICHMAEIDHLVVIINKMDLVGWDEARFKTVALEMQSVADSLGFEKVTIIPVSAILGDNVTHKADQNMPWYKGTTLLDEVIWAEPELLNQHNESMLFPVQYIIRDGQDFRGLSGTLAQGTLKKGMAIKDALSGLSSTIARIVTLNGDLEETLPGEAVTLVLEDDRDIARGSVLIAQNNETSFSANTIKAQLVWLHDKPFNPAALPLLRTVHDHSAITKMTIQSATDLTTFEQTYCERLRMNDLVNVTIEIARPLICDDKTGSTMARFILVDPLEGTTLAAGIISETSLNDAKIQTDEDAQDYYHTVHLTHQDLAQALFTDLSASEKDKNEFHRRAQALETLLKKHGVNVMLSLDSSEL